MSLSVEASQAVRQAYTEAYMQAAEFYAGRPPIEQARALRQKLERHLRTQRQALGVVLQSRELEWVQLAVVALLDESARHWLGAEGVGQWESLQFEYYRQEILGARFFQELDRLKGDSSVPVEVLEVYFRCLCLGFQGEYAPARLQELASVQLALENHLQRITPPPPPLAPQFEDVQGSPPPAFFLRPSQTVLLTAVILSLLALFVSLTLRLESRRVATTLERALDTPEKLMKAPSRASPAQGGADGGAP